jgi:hypothetical protein
MTEMPEVLVAPLFIETGEFTSRITMVNELNFAVTANVIVRDSQGAQIASQLVNFTAHSQQALMVADVSRSANSEETVGSIEILPDPAQVVSMAIAAQISITGTGGSAGQHIEEEFLMAGTQGSGVLRAAGTSLTGQPIVALKNASPAPQTATISCITEKEGTTQQQLQLAAGGSALVRACTGVPNSGINVIVDALAAPAPGPNSRGAFGISIAGSGPPGSLLVFGFSWRHTARGPLLSSQNFVDAGTQGR